MKQADLSTLRDVLKQFFTTRGVAIPADAALHVSVSLGSTTTDGRPAHERAFASFEFGETLITGTVVSGRYEAYQYSSADDYASRTSMNATLKLTPEEIRAHLADQEAKQKPPSR